MSFLHGVIFPHPPPATSKQTLKKRTQNRVKTAPKRAIQKTAEATCDLAGNKIGDKILKVLKTLTQNNSETNEKHVIPTMISNLKLR